MTYPVTVSRGLKAEEGGVYVVYVRQKHYLQVKYLDTQLGKYNMKRIRFRFVSITVIFLSYHYFRSRMKSSAIYVSARLEQLWCI